jgi:hypothetical protein
VNRNGTLPPEGSVEYDSEDGTYTVRDIWAPGVPPSQRVIEAVAAVTGTDPSQTEPLFDAVDPDALDELFASTWSGRVRPSTGRVTFRYGEHDVTLHAGGRIVMAPRVEEAP